MSFYDDATTNYAAFDDFYCYDKSRAVEAENALDYIGSLMGFAESGSESGLTEMINLIVTFLFDCFQTPKFNDEK